MARPYGGHHLTEEQKKLAEDNYPLVWWFLNKYVLVPGVIRRHEIDDCSGYLIFKLCLAAESFDPDRDIKFSSYAVKALRSGLYRYLSLRTQFDERFVSVDFGSHYDFHGKTIRNAEEPMYKPYNEKKVSWEDIKPLFDLIDMTSLEEQIIFFTYEKKYPSRKIGKIIGLTGERIRQHHRLIVDKLKKAVKKNNISIEDFILV